MVLTVALLLLLGLLVVRKRCQPWSVMVVFGLFLLSAAAGAQDGHVHGHAQYHESYRTWCQPGKGPNCLPRDSCCDAREVKHADGRRSVDGHCYPTEFRPNPSGRTDWIARLSPEDVEQWGVEWLELPDHKRVRETNPDPSGVTGHLCTNWQTKEILCSVPPTGAL